MDLNTCLITFLSQALNNLRGLILKVLFTFNYPIMGTQYIYHTHSPGRVLPLVGHSPGCCVWSPPTSQDPVCSLNLLNLKTVQALPLAWGLQVYSQYADPLSSIAIGKLRYPWSSCLAPGTSADPSVSPETKYTFPQNSSPVGTLGIQFSSSETYNSDSKRTQTAFAQDSKTRLLFSQQHEKCKDLNKIINTSAHISPSLFPHYSREFCGQRAESSKKSRTFSLPPTFDFLSRA